ncbi:GntR family transcriptional regulator [Parasporobacterium paucivorans]|uniref:Transcriptional regulator, GntR family n=1 Tax=Parasporobacterium paucivorans DSM 15970 TaxID=1122934 RepID=A0A1M6BEH4_9FIRM|nr:GntR family transcriptional regulator [Parasporobacterium paucivorans]SHI47142.1 transcriptional regulator, GntR family [Parasporobacterium paucivorans DSM 15970]
MKNLDIANDEFLPLRDIVFRNLREAIIKGDLKPGERLMEIKLAQKLGVSRTPVREAIRMLQLEGLVTMEPRRGAEVAPITAKELTDVLEVRTALECLAAELACERITEEEEENLRNSLSVFKEAIEKNELTEVAGIDAHFHELIYKATKNERLVQILNNLREHIFRYRLEYIREIERRQDLLDEHIDIVNAILNHDKEAARNGMKKHIEKQEKYILTVINEDHTGR